jgi:hypothetical protein
MAVYDGKMDKECVPLCNAINTIPGLVTDSSCSGHNKGPLHIWFHVSDLALIANLNMIARVIDRRYGGPTPCWECLLVNCDTHPISFLLKSANKGAKAYEESLIIVSNIQHYSKHEAYKKLFNIVM